MKKTHQDMTVGSISGNLVRFALPLLAGNLFQQLYNMVDTWVIGQSSNNAAYAAVGSVGPVINTLVGFFSGLATGAGVVISQYFGAGNREKVEKTVHTSVMMTLVMVFLFTGLGTFLAPKMAEMMLSTDNGDPEVLREASVYLTIYFAGVSGLMVYNMGAGILRAIGDSRNPFYYLVVSTVLNILLDLLFVFKLGMSADGVAYATIIAQFASAVLIVIKLLRTDSWVRVRPKQVRIDREMLGKIIQVGIPSALQMSVTAFSNVFVQSYIAGTNGVQAYNLGGWTTYNKIDQFIFLPLTSLALAISTFVGQNLGKGNVERAKKGTYVAYGLATAVTAVVIVIVELFAPQLAAFFNPDENVVANATLLLRCMTPFYFFCCVNQVFMGSLRGSGDSTAAMILCLSTFVGFRQIYLFVMSRFISNDLLPIGFGYPAGWVVCCICTLIYFFSCKFGAKVVVEKE